MIRPAPLNRNHAVGIGIFQMLEKLGVGPTLPVTVTRFYAFDSVAVLTPFRLRLRLGSGFDPVPVSTRFRFQLDSGCDSGSDFDSVSVPDSVSVSFST
jgi:hypothetical protein